MIVDKRVCGNTDRLSNESSEFIHILELKMTIPTHTNWIKMMTAIVCYIELISARRKSFHTNTLKTKAIHLSLLKYNQSYP